MIHTAIRKTKPIALKAWAFVFHFFYGSSSSKGIRCYSLASTLISSNNFNPSSIAILNSKIAFIMFGLRRFGNRAVERIHNYAGHVRPWSGNTLPGLRNTFFIFQPDLEMREGPITTSDCLLTWIWAFFIVEGYRYGPAGLFITFEMVAVTIPMLNWSCVDESLK